VYICICIYIFVCVYVCMYIYAYVYFCVYAYVCEYILIKKLSAGYCRMSQGSVCGNLLGQQAFSGIYVYICEYIYIRGYRVHVSASHQTCVAVCCGQCELQCVAVHAAPTSANRTFLAYMYLYIRIYTYTFVCECVC